MTRQETIDFLLEHYRQPSNRGRMDGADVVATGGNPGCGDVITIYLKVDAEGDRVGAVGFEGEGCTISQAAASILTEMIAGAPLARIEAMDYKDMIDALGREVVETRPRCATLALGTLKAAVRRYRRGALAADCLPRADANPASPPVCTP